MLDDWKAALRSLRRHPAFTLIAALTLAVGIGATTATFSVVESILLRPLPYPDADRLVDISHLTKEGRRLLVPWYDLADVRLETEIFEGVAARAGTPGEIVLTGEGDETYHTSALWATHDYLPVLGVAPELGRALTVEDAVAAEFTQDPDAPPPVQTALVSHGLWQRMLGADPNLAGRTIRLTGRAVKIVGVLPPDFQLLHERRHRRVGGDVEVFFAMPEGFIAQGRPEGRQGRNALFIGRLREGVTEERAQAAMDALAARYRAEIPYYAEGELRLPVTPIRDDLTEGTGPIVLVLVTGLMFLMLLVCANVANLMLVRGQLRSGEDAVRSVLGCGRLRLVSNRAWESLWIGILGGGLGVTLGWMAIRGVQVFGPRHVPLLDLVELNLPTVSFAIVATLVVVLVFGVVPTIQAWRIDLAAILRADAGRGGARGRRGLMRGLVIAELATSTVLLSGAIIMVRSMVELTRADVGFDPQGVLAFDLIPTDSEQRERDDWGTVYRQLEDRLRAVPGVQAVARTSMPPLSGRVFNRNFGWTPEVLERQSDRADVTTVSADYFRAMGTRLLAGRGFDERDLEEGTRSIIVDEWIAERAWPGEDPIGKTIYYTGEGTVVGVVESMMMRDFGTEEIVRGAIHRPEVRFGTAWTFVVRSSVDPASIVRLLRETVREVDPGLTPYNILDLSARLAVSRAPTRFVLFSMGAFAIVAFLVAVGGLFGVISYGVRTRTGEFGLRIALGAEGSVIRGMVLRQGAILTLTGVTLGLAGTWAVSRVLGSVAYQVAPTDPVILGLTALILGLTSMLACYAPARWASGVDPVRALSS
jgi:predicted permease